MVSMMLRNLNKKKKKLIFVSHADREIKWKEKILFTVNYKEDNSKIAISLAH